VVDPPPTPPPVFSFYTLGGFKRGFVVFPLTPKKHPHRGPWFKTQTAESPGGGGVLGQPPPHPQSCANQLPWGGVTPGGCGGGTLGCGGVFFFWDLGKPPLSVFIFFPFFSCPGVQKHKHTGGHKFPPVFASFFGVRFLPPFGSPHISGGSKKQVPPSQTNVVGFWGGGGAWGLFHHSRVGFFQFATFFFFFFSFFLRDTKKGGWFCGTPQGTSGGGCTRFSSSGAWLGFGGFVSTPFNQLKKNALGTLVFHPPEKKLKQPGGKGGWLKRMTPNHQFFFGFVFRFFFCFEGLFSLFFFFLFFSCEGVGGLVETFFFVFLVFWWETFCWGREGRGV